MCGMMGELCRIDLFWLVGLEVCREIMCYVRRTGIVLSLLLGCVWCVALA